MVGRLAGATAALLLATQPAVADKGFEVDLSVEVVSTSYFRGLLNSAEPHQPAISPAATLTLDAGVYFTVWHNTVLVDRDVNDVADEVDITVGYERDFGWLALDTGGNHFHFYGYPDLSELREWYLIVSSGEKIPVATFQATIAFGSEVSAGAATPFWYGELGAGAAHDFGSHAVEGGVTLGVKSPDLSGIALVDLRVQASYKWTHPLGFYVSPGVTYAYVFEGDGPHLIWGSVKVGWVL